MPRNLSLIVVNLPCSNVTMMLRIYHINLIPSQSSKSWYFTALYDSCQDFWLLPSHWHLQKLFFHVQALCGTPDQFQHELVWGTKINPGRLKLDVYGNHSNWLWATGNLSTIHKPFTYDICDVSLLEFVRAVQPQPNLPVCQRQQQQQQQQ